MIKSRLRRRRTSKTFEVKVKTLASGQHTEANVAGLSAIVGTREERDAVEVANDAGAIVGVTDVFWFEPKAGDSIPAIEEKHVLIDGDSVRYEVLQVINQAGQDNRLRVLTRRVR